MRQVITALVVVTLVLQTRGASSAATDKRLAAITCVANATSPVIFYGQLPRVRYLDQQPSYVQIFPATDISDFYLDSLADRVHGVTPTAPPGVDGMDFEKHRLDMTIASINMQTTGVHAIVSRKGAWACRGFSPGKYSFLATVYALGRTQASNGDDTLVTQYYRADVDVPSTSKPAVLVPVSPFRLVGQTPP